MSWPRPGSAWATASAYAIESAPPISTWRSSPCWPPAPPTCRRRGRPGRAGRPGLGEAGVAVILAPGGHASIGPSRSGRPPHGHPGRPDTDDDSVDHLPPPDRRQAPIGRRGHPPVGRRVRRRRGADFLVDDPIVREDRVLAGLPSRFERVLRGDWLAWRYGAAWSRPARAPWCGPASTRPWLVEQRIPSLSRCDAGAVITGPAQTKAVLSQRSR